jgi:rhodanese-related sulfurtransferase
MTIDDVLVAARGRLRRLQPREAAQAVADGALLVDTRPAWQRERFGTISGALVIERNHLEWRLDPTSDAKIPQAADRDLYVIIICQEGYSSSLAAASLQDIGLHRATDVVGGFERWCDDGLPTVHAR